jgi:hypothetical protein
VLAQMCGGAAERTVGAMPRSLSTHTIRTLVGAFAAGLCALALWPGAGHAAGTTQTLRVFDKPVAMTLTRADGTVVRHAPFPEAKAGDVLDVYALDFVGNHRNHEKHASMSSHLRCTFGDGGPPVCENHVAIGGSLLIFLGDKVVAGTGRYAHATGRVLSSKEVDERANTSDVVARIHL